MYIILEIDNVISDDSWRADKIKNEKLMPSGKFHEYNMLCGFDVPGNEWLFDNDHEVVVLTSRPRFYVEPTKQWLLNANISPACLIMREDNDHSSSLQLRKKQLFNFSETMKATADQIVGAYDSQQEIVDMYSDSGIPSYLVSIHREHEK
jgi:hypothetical protein|tara:strand:- start:272 stop:721 length:450 start_codon:yes stop_codon:yes gene_type:complete